MPRPPPHSPQSGLDLPYGGHARAGNVVVRGVVITTYFADEEDRLDLTGEALGISIRSHQIKAIACDVLTYGGSFNYFLPRIPVAQMRHGLNDHDLWVPRGTTVDLRTGEYPIFPQGIPSGMGDNTSRATEIQDQTLVGDPVDYDGDHVLVEFLENDPQQGFVRADMLPHPRATFRMEKAQGDVRRLRHRGVVQEIDAKGNWSLDARGANDGDVDADNEGVETAADDDTHGNVTIRANANAEYNLFGENADGSNPQYRLRMKANELLAELAGDLSLLLTGNQADTNLTIGDGAVSVAIAETLEALWGLLAAHIDAHVHPLASHVHSAGALLDGLGSPVSGTTGSPTPDLSLTPTTSTPTWDAEINSDKVTIPDNDP